MNPSEHPTEPMATTQQDWFADPDQSTAVPPPQAAYPAQPTFQSGPYASDGGRPRSGIAPGLVAGIAALSLIAGGAAGAGAGALIANNTASGSGQSSATAPTSGESLQLVSSDVSSLAVKVVGRVGPAVVSIRNDQTPQQSIYGTSQATSAGSGVVIDSHGYILTNNHVVANAQSLTVTFSNATTAKASIVGTDPTSDIAVIKVDTKVPAVALLGDSSKLKAGQTVIAIGNALGNLQNTVTEGIISGLNRTLSDTSDPNNSISLQNLIQTDAAINHGNSGGPLVDLTGHVIGINTAVLRTSGNGAQSTADQAQGLGFSIPSNTARSIADRLIFHTPSPMLGVVAPPVSAQVASAYNIPIGAMVTSIGPDSGAARAGLRKQDIITAVDGLAVDEGHTLKGLIDAHAVGDKVKLSVYRDGQTITLTATLGKAKG